MRVLALDSTTRAGSVALVEHDRVLYEASGDPSRPHAQRLPRELIAVLDQAGLTPAAVDVFAVTAGPGSFTGLRIGIATIQGLALATGRPVVAASGLELVALAGAAAWPPGTLVAAWIDALRGDVFSALYRRGALPTFHPGHLIELDPPRVERPEVVAARWKASHGLPQVIAGDGAQLYATPVAPGVAVVAMPRLAGILGQWASARAREGAAVHPAAVQPVYVRRPDAEIARERAEATRSRPDGRSA